MQSTFSAMSTGVESITYDEEDDDETDGNVGGATREAADISPVGSVASNNANGGYDTLQSIAKCLGCSH